MTARSNVQEIRNLMARLLVDYVRQELTLKDSGTTWMEDFAQFLSGLLMVRIHVGDVFLKNRNKMPDEDPQ